MPYIKDPDFAEICALTEAVEEIHNDNIGPNTNAAKRIINKIQIILRRYSKRE